MTEVIVANDAMARLRTELARAPFHAFLELEPVSADAELGSIALRIGAKPEFRRAYDSEDWHGGVLAAVIDMAAHAAVAVRIGAMAPTIDLRIDYLAPARGQLTATGTVLRAGRTIGRSDVTLRDAHGVVVALGRGTFSCHMAPTTRAAT